MLCRYKYSLSINYRI